MDLRFVRKWKVKSAAWAGVAAGLVAGPLAYALLVTSEASSPPPSKIVATKRSTDSPPLEASRSAEALPSPTDQRLAVLLRTIRSDRTDLRIKTDAVARIGRLDHPSAVETLTTLAKEKRQGADPNFVGLAALSALWARGERQLVHELADASPDPVVKSKALALARARAK